MTSITQISDKFAAIMNPYGKVYLEENVSELKTFKRILKYIAYGGIFLCIGGLAFFYAWSRKTTRKLPTGEGFQIYVEIGNLKCSKIEGTIMSGYPYTPPYSFLDTLLKRTFLCVNYDR